MLIRPATAADDPAVEHVHRTAFGDHGAVVAGLLPELTATVSLAAEVDGEVVGHVQCGPGWLDAPRRLLEVLVLSPLGVLPGRQVQGVGSALVRAALARAEELGAAAVFLEGDPAYYGRLGFRAGGELGFRRPSLRIPAAAFQVVLLPAHEPWMTGTLVYPDVFWRHDAVGLRDPGA